MSLMDADPGSLANGSKAPEDTLCILVLMHPLLDLTQSSWSLCITIGFDESPPASPSCNNNKGSNNRQAVNPRSSKVCELPTTTWMTLLTTMATTMTTTKITTTMRIVTTATDGSNGAVGQPSPKPRLQLAQDEPVQTNSTSLWKITQLGGTSLPRFGLVLGNGDGLMDWSWSWSFQIREKTRPDQTFNHYLGEGPCIRYDDAGKARLLRRVEELDKEKKLTLAELDLDEEAQDAIYQILRAKNPKPKTLDNALKACPVDEEGSQDEDDGPPHSEDHGSEPETMLQCTAEGEEE
ncbi:hypothetical protein EDB83DRAFT_2318777 [Lactarius deliciosus]|nr:hypothetical protein EDB83DRAFT_2318777 [Lactarius deliciosus]